MTKYYTEVTTSYIVNRKYSVVLKQW